MFMIQLKKQDKGQVPTKFKGMNRYAKSFIVVASNTRK